MLISTALVTGSEPKEPIRVKGTLKDRPVIRRPIRCQDGIDREGPIRFRVLGRTAPKSVDQSGRESRLTRSHPTMHISEHPRCIGHSRLDRLEIDASFYYPTVLFSELPRISEAESSAPKTKRRNLPRRPSCPGRLASWSPSSNVPEKNRRRRQRGSPTPVVTFWRPTWGRFWRIPEEPTEDQPSMVLTRSQSSEEVEPNISSGASSMAPNKDQPEVSSAQVQSAMLEALQRTSHSLAEALERLSTRNSSPPSAAPPVVLKLEDYLPTFSGDPDEDPDYFIQRLEEYFAEPANAHLSEEVKVRVVHKQLRGPVFKRYKAFASRDREFRAVKDRLMTHYGVEKNFTALYETFQKGHVEKCEDFEVFCARQETLYHRLFPGAPESRLVAELVKQLPRELRPHLVASGCRTVTSLVEMALQLAAHTQKPTYRSGGSKVSQPAENWRRTEPSPSRSASAE
jgi:hypothetical protein